MGYYIDNYFIKMKKGGSIRFVLTTRKREISKLTERGYQVYKEDGLDVKYIFDGEQYVKAVEETTKYERRKKTQKIEESGDA